MTLEGARLFGLLSPAQRAAVEEAAECRRYAAGEVLCRKGEVGRACLVINSGGVVVHVDRAAPGDTHRVYLGPGQVLGEMSLLSETPVAATVVAAVDTEVSVISGPMFLDLVEGEERLRDGLFELLIERMQHRESVSGPGDEAPCTLLVAPPGSRRCDRLCDALFRGINHYAPGSVFVDARLPDAGGPAAPTPEDALRGLASGGGPTRIVTGGGPAWSAELIEKWRVGGGAGRRLCILLAPTLSQAIGGLLRPSDLVLLLRGRGDHGDPPDGSSACGPARVDRVLIGTDQEPDPAGQWPFRVSQEEIDGIPAQDAAAWAASRWPAIDWLARRVTGREIGIALGAGGAGGFAHLGVLQILEEAGIGVDYVCGSSMGGVVAVTYARVGNASDVIQMSRELAGSNNKLLDFTLRPRSALFRGAKRAAVAQRVLGDVALSQLGKPTATVAADLVTGERFVFESGPARQAWLATSAIPGIFPPESYEGRLLVDGAVISRVPTDLLNRRRCGLKIAVNVVPSTTRAREDSRQLEGTYDRFLGLAQVIASSWGLLAGWRSAAEAAQADILLEPRQERCTGFDFGTIEDKIEAGRIAAMERLDMIRDAVSRLLRPGAP